MSVQISSNSFSRISLECESSCHNKSVSTGFGLHTDHGCFSQSNTKKMFKLAYSQLGNKHVWLLYVECSSLLFHGQFLLISHTAMNLRSQLQKQTGRVATVHIQIQQTMTCNGKQSLLLEMAWLLCTLHSLRIQMSAVVLCLMCQIRVLIPSTVDLPHARFCIFKNYQGG